MVSPGDRADAADDAHRRHAGRPRASAAPARRPRCPATRWPARPAPRSRWTRRAAATRRRRTGSPSPGCSRPRTRGSSIAIMLDAPDGGASAAPLFHDIATYLAQRDRLPVSADPSSRVQTLQSPHPDRDRVPRRSGAGSRAVRRIALVRRAVPSGPPGGRVAAAGSLRTCQSVRSTAPVRRGTAAPVGAWPDRRRPADRGWRRWPRAGAPLRRPAGRRHRHHPAGRRRAPRRPVRRAARRRGRTAPTSPPTALAAGAVAVLTDPAGAARPALRDGGVPVLVHPRPARRARRAGRPRLRRPDRRGCAVLGVTGTSGKTTIDAPARGRAGRRRPRAPG